jgi:hypothetical protein
LTVVRNCLFVEGLQPIKPWKTTNLMTGSASVRPVAALAGRDS